MNSLKPFQAFIQLFSFVFPFFHLFFIKHHNVFITYLAKSKARLPPNFTQKLLMKKTFSPSSLAISIASSTIATSSEDCAGPSAETGLGSVGDFHPYEVGSPIGRVLPFSPLKEPMSKPLIQYKRKGRKPKSAVGQGELEDVGFL
jgi:hypothetical protein